MKLHYEYKFIKNIFYTERDHRLSNSVVDWILRLQRKKYFLNIKTVLKSLLVRESGSIKVMSLAKTDI